MRKLLYKAKQWWVCVEKWWFRDVYRQYIRVPIGSLRKPVALEWVDWFHGKSNTVVLNGQPQCPRCGEIPYDMDQCVFCGQKFI